MRLKAEKEAPLAKEARLKVEEHKHARLNVREGLPLKQYGYISRGMSSSTHG